MRWFLVAAPIAAGVALAAPGAVHAEDKPDALLDAMVAELERSKSTLASQGEEPMYYLSYRVHDGYRAQCSASYGALDSGGSDEPDAARSRSLDVTCRVGSPKL